MKRNDLSEKAARKRMNSQMPIEKKIEMADIVIENSGSIFNTKKQTEDIISLLRSSKRHIRNKFIICSSIIGLLFVIYILYYYFTQ